MVFVLEKLNFYTLGRRTAIFFDHQPPQTITSKPLHITKHAHLITKYDLDLWYQHGKKMLLADKLSRAQRSDSEDANFELEPINSVEAEPVISKKLQILPEETQKD